MQYIVVFPGWVIFLRLRLWQVVDLKLVLFKQVYLLRFLLRGTNDPLVGAYTRAHNIAAGRTPLEVLRLRTSKHHVIVFFRVNNSAL